MPNKAETCKRQDPALVCQWRANHRRFLELDRSTSVRNLARTCYTVLLDKFLSIRGGCSGPEGRPCGPEAFHRVLPSSKSISCS